jgi:CheY-like chemotaxis protein
MLQRGKPISMNDVKEGKRRQPSHFNNLMKSQGQDKPVLLIAEDDPDDRLLDEVVLRSFMDRLELCFVSNGEELMGWLSRGSRCGGPDLSQPKLILLNLNMPIKDGFQALTEIKRDPELKKIAVIVWTTASDENERRLCLEIGAESYLTKPSNFAELETALRMIVEKWFPPAAKKFQIPTNGIVANSMSLVDTMR